MVGTNCKRESVSYSSYSFSTFEFLAIHKKLIKYDADHRFKLLGEYEELCLGEMNAITKEKIDLVMLKISMLEWMDKCNKDKSCMLGVYHYKISLRNFLLICILMSLLLFSILYYSFSKMAYTFELFSFQLAATILLFVINVIQIFYFYDIIVSSDAIKITLEFLGISGVSVFYFTTIRNLINIQMNQPPSP